MTLTERAVLAKRVPGEPGMWIVVFGDILVFSALFCMFLYYRADDPDGFASAQQYLSPTVGLFDTLVLLTSSLAVVLAVRGRDRRYLDVAIALGAVFVVAKSLEWWSKVDAGFTPHSDMFFMLYFVLTGLHLGHVFVGLFLLAIVRPIAGNSDVRASAYLEGAAVFWHMVDLIWLALFPVVYLLPLAG